MELHDLRVIEMSGPEPVFDAVMSDFLLNSRQEFLDRFRPGGLLEYADLGTRLPWLSCASTRSAIAMASRRNVRAWAKSPAPW